ncbi:MAG: hypothetical protein U0Q18_12335 [Bryobacteraceae bacterium]
MISPRLPARDKKLSCILYTMLSADGSACSNPVKQFRDLLKRIDKADSVNSADKVLQEAFHRGQASIDYPDIFPPNQIVSGTYVKQALGEGLRVLRRQGGFAVGPKVLIADGDNEGGRYGKTQTKGGQILTGKKLGNVVMGGLLFDATYCSQDEYRGCGSEFSKISRMEPFTRKEESDTRCCLPSSKSQWLASQRRLLRGDLTPDKIQLSKQPLVPRPVRRHPFP